MSTSNPYFYNVYKAPSLPILLADALASRNNSFTSPMSSKETSFRPDSPARMEAGVRSCSAYLEFVNCITRRSHENSPEGGPFAFCGQFFKYARPEANAFHARTDLDYFCDLRFVIWLSFDYQTPVKLGTEQLRGIGISAYRSSRSTGIPCADITSVVPRTSALPRLVANMTVGAIGDSNNALRYVKHSMSSMWTFRASQHVRRIANNVVPPHQ